MACTSCVSERDALAQSSCIAEEDTVSGSSLSGHKWPQRERTSWKHVVAPFSPASKAAFLWKWEDTAPFSSTELQGWRDTISNTTLASLADHLPPQSMAQLTGRQGWDARAAGSSPTPGQVLATTLPCPTTKPPLRCSQHQQATPDVELQSQVRYSVLSSPPTRTVAIGTGQGHQQVESCRNCFWAPSETRLAEGVGEQPRPCYATVILCFHSPHATGYQSLLTASNLYKP